jgi:hypothetical protein
MTAALALRLQASSRHVVDRSSSYIACQRNLDGSFTDRTSVHAIYATQIYSRACDLDEAQILNRNLPQMYGVDGFIASFTTKQNTD